MWPENPSWTSYASDLPEAGGYTLALRQLATLADGSTAFVKTPTNDVTRRMLLAEIAAYEAIGQDGFDVVAWAPSLALEGGPEPWALLPDAALHHAAFVTGYFAQRSPLPPIPDAPGVRPFQLAQLRVCLPWFARLLHR